MDVEPYAQGLPILVEDSRWTSLWTCNTGETRRYCQINTKILVLPLLAGPWRWGWRHI